MRATEHYDLKEFLPQPVADFARPVLPHCLTVLVPAGYIPILLLSARAGEEAAIEGLAAGADDYLVKPFSARELLARVATNLELGQERQATAQNDRVGVVCHTFANSHHERERSPAPMKIKTIYNFSISRCTKFSQREI